MTATAAILASLIEVFALPTTDGVTTINGEIDYPDGATEAVAAVLMVPGTGLFDRDGLWGHSGADADFVFRDLAAELNALGIAAVRYDYRGVKCNMRTMPVCGDCQTAADKVQHFYEQCLDSSVRATVTPENVRSDIAQVFAHARTQAKIDADRVAIFGHSEGSLNTAHAVADGQISPSGLVYMGFLAESPTGIVRWQMTDRYLRILSWDADRDGSLTNAEIRVGYVADPYFSILGVPMDAFLAPSGAWTEATLRATIDDTYNDVRVQALETDDSSPYKLDDLGHVFASQRWWKQFFNDDVSVAALLTAFDGPIFAHNGTGDSQTPADREFAFVTGLSGAYRHAPVLRTYAGKGHGLSDHPLYGPIDPDIKVHILRDLEAATRTPAR